MDEDIVSDYLDESEIDFEDTKASSVLRNIKYEEIVRHIVNGTMYMKAIQRNYSNPEWGEFTYWALYDHKRTKLQPLIDKKQSEFEEVVGEAIRKLVYDKKDVLEALLAYAVEAMQSGTLRIRTVNELVKVTDQLFKLAGEGEYNTVKMKVGWGTELEDNPRTKGKIFTAEDFDKTVPSEEDYR